MTYKFIFESAKQVSAEVTSEHSKYKLTSNAATVSGISTVNAGNIISTFTR